MTWPLQFLLSAYLWLFAVSVHNPDHVRKEHGLIEGSLRDAKAWHVRNGRSPFAATWLALWEHTGELQPLALYRKTVADDTYGPAPSPIVALTEGRTQLINRWTERDSANYLELNDIMTIDRAGREETFIALIPFEEDDAFKIIDLGCGNGRLASKLLDTYQRATLLALDGSSSMRQNAKQLLEGFGERAVVEDFDLGTEDWRPRLADSDCVIASTCIAFLPDREKRRLFANICENLSDHGVFLIADLVAPPRPEIRRLHAATHIRAIETQSIEQTGSKDLFEKGAQVTWDIHQNSRSDERPSSLFDQLTWLKEAGFEAVDCFWLRSGQAIFGGYKSGPEEGWVPFQR